MKAAASAGRGAEGVIRIGILASVSGGFLRDLIGSYRGCHPAITMEIVEGSASQHLAQITERQLDVAFITGTPAATHCDSAVLWEARVFAALPKGHALADGEAICWESLRHEDFIVSRDAPGPEIHDYIVRRTTAFGRSPSIERHGVGRETLMHLVGLGFGISIASEASMATRYPDVVFRPLATAEDTLPYSAVWLPGNDNPALRRFLSLAYPAIPPPGEETEKDASGREKLKSREKAFFAS
jgi:DNA-binding transcriptional LysR family regulator